MADDPIVLPGLAAQRAGPSAAVCTSGHVLRWLVDPSVEIQHCPKCGDRILFACPACSAPLPPDGEMLQWVPYHSFCSTCGKPYPWIGSEIARAKRALAEAGEAERWDETVMQRAGELIDDIAGERTTPSYVTAGVHWLSQRGAENAAQTVLDVVGRLGTAELKQGMRPHFPGQF